MFSTEIFNKILSNNSSILKQSREIDNALGLNVLEIEKKLCKELFMKNPQGNLHSFGKTEYNGNQTWIGLEPDVFQTPYSELLEILNIITPKEGELLVDLGAGYGRIGFLMNAFFSKAKFQGYEYVEERVIEANNCFKRHGLESKLFQADLTEDNFELPVADYYFIYDYSHPEHIRHTLNKISDVADNKKITVIGRGKGVRSIIEYNHPWLSDVQTPFRNENYTIYYT